MRRTEPTASQAPQPQAVIGQVAVAISKASDRKVEIRLDPPELGRVQIHLTPIDGGVQAVVMAQRPETQDLLRRHAEMLAHELGAAGYGNVSLDFAAGGEAPAGRGDARADWAHAARARRRPSRPARGRRAAAAACRRPRHPPLTEPQERHMEINPTTTATPAAAAREGPRRPRSGSGVAGTSRRS